MDSDLVGRALAFAARAHTGQLRKGTSIPYIVHPAEVAAICARLTSDERAIAAAALHDVVEDTPFTLEDIRAEFGDRVAEIVEAETCDVPEEATWRQCKLETLRKISETQDRDVLCVSLADKLSNMRSMRKDTLELGEAHWSRFHVDDPKEHAWYYRSLTRELARTLSDTLEWRELSALVEEVFGRV